MIKIRCEQVSPGLREADAILTFLDFHGRRHFLQIEKAFLVHRNGHSYLPVGWVRRDARTGAFLIELPHEAETGVNRLWVSADQVPSAKTFVLPIGGGGLASGIAIALRALRPGVRIVGVQAGKTSGVTIADGISVKHPGVLTMAILDDLLDDIVHVEDEEIAEAITLLLERSKLVVEGAGAASMAARVGRT